MLLDKVCKLQTCGAQFHSTDEGTPDYAAKKQLAEKTQAFNFLFLRK